MSAPDASSSPEPIALLRNSWRPHRLLFAWCLVLGSLAAFLGEPFNPSIGATAGSVSIGAYAAANGATIQLHLWLGVFATLALPFGLLGVALLAVKRSPWLATAGGTGFIWTMQVLNYPLLARIGPESFVAYETEHNRRFIRVVGPGLVVAVVATVLLIFVRPRGLSLAGPISAAVILLAIILLTIRFQAPAHGALARGFDPIVHRTLVRTNWFRALAWTALGILDLFLVYWSVTA